MPEPVVPVPVVLEPPVVPEPLVEPRDPEPVLELEWDEPVSARVVEVPPELELLVELEVVGPQAARAWTSSSRASGRRVGLRKSDLRGFGLVSMLATYRGAPKRRPTHHPATGLSQTRCLPVPGR